VGDEAVSNAWSQLEGDTMGPEPLSRCIFELKAVNRIGAVFKLKGKTNRYKLDCRGAQ